MRRSILACLSAAIIAACVGGLAPGASAASRNVVIDYSVAKAGVTSSHFKQFATVVHDAGTNPGDAKASSAAMPSSSPMLAETSNPPTVPRAASSGRTRALSRVGSKAYLQGSGGKPAGQSDSSELC